MRIRGRTLRRLLIVASCAAVIALVAMTALQVSRKGAADAATAARAAGLLAYERGDFETAVEELPRARSHDREDLTVLLAYADSRSRVHLENGQHLQSAVNLYNEALRLEPKNIEALEALLTLHGRLGWRGQAMEVANRILSDVDPDNIAALAAVAGIQLAEKRHDASIATLERLVELQPETLGWRLLLVDVMRAGGASDDALLALCDSWIHSGEGANGGQLVRARVLWRLGRVRPAADALIGAAGHGVSTRDEYQQLVRLFDEMTLRPGAVRDGELLRRLAAARDELIKSVHDEHGAAPWGHEALIVRHWREGELDSALAAVDRATASMPEADHRILLWKAAVLWGRGDWDGTDAVLTTLEDLAPSLEVSDRVWVASWTRAFRAAHQQDTLSWPDTRNLLTEAVDLAPSDAVVQFVFARACRRAGSLELAVRAYEHVAVLDPLWIGPQLVLAELLLELERPDEALRRLAALHRRALRPGLRLHLLTARAWVEAARADEEIFLTSAETGRPVNVVEVLQALHEAGERPDMVVPLLVRAHHQRGELREAQGVIRDALSADPADPEVLLAIVSVCDDAALAEKLLERAEASGGQTEATVLARARHLAASGEHAAALSVLEECGSTTAIRYRIQVLATTDEAAAIEAMQSHLESTPDEMTASFVLGQPVTWTDRALVEKAIERLEAAIGPEAPRAIIARGRAVLQFESADPEKLSNAIGAVNRVLRRTPDALAARTLIAALLLAGDEQDAGPAIEHLREAIGAHPQRWDLYPRLIALLQAHSRFEEAEEYLVRLGGASSLGPEIRRAELELLRAQGSLDSAISRLESMIDDDSAEEELLTLAAWYVEDGRRDLAADIYERVLASAPSPLARLQMADFLADGGDTDRAISVLQSIDAGAPSPERDYRTAQFLLEHGDRGQALALLRSALDAAPDRADVRVALARELVRRGACEEARRIASESSHAALRRVWLIASLQQGGDARREALAALRETSGYYEAEWLATETLRDQCGDGVPTARDLEAASALTDEHGQFLPAWELAIALHHRAGKLDAACALAERATFRFPRHPQPAEWWTRTLVAAGRTSEAIESAAYWRERSRDRTLVADVVTASLHLDLNPPGHAVAFIGRHEARIRREGEHHPERLLVLGRALLMSGELDEAEAIAAPHLADKMWSRMWFGAVARLSVPRAREALARVEPLAVDDAVLRRPLASAWAELARRSGDPQHFDRADHWASQLDGYDAALLRGSIAEGRGDLGAAEALYRESLTLAPEDPIALNNLAAVLLARGRGHADAVELAERAIRHAPDLPDLHDTLAQALLSVGRAEEAIAASRRATELDATRPSLHLTLARALVEVGRRDEARQALNRIEAMLVDGGGTSESIRPDLEALRRRLEAGVRRR